MRSVAHVHAGAIDQNIQRAERWPSTNETASRHSPARPHRPDGRLIGGRTVELLAGGLERFARRPAMATRHPSRASASATPKPMPVPPPVTRAVVARQAFRHRKPFFVHGRGRRTRTVERKLSSRHASTKARGPAVAISAELRVPRPPPICRRTANGIRFVSNVCCKSCDKSDDVDCPTDRQRPGRQSKRRRAVSAATSSITWPTGSRASSSAAGGTIASWPGPCATNRSRCRCFASSTCCRCSTRASR